jgi:hypothetical protein
MCSEDAPAMLIGAVDGDHIMVYAHAREFPQCSDYWDANWLVCEVKLSSKGFTAHYLASLRSDEFDAFKKQLESLYRTLTGESKFSPLEKCLNIQMKGDGRGHCPAECEAWDWRSQNVLKVTIELDQTYIPYILRSIDEILEEFPVIGQQPG